MNNTYIIQGGSPACGTVKLSGAKNVSLKLMIASMLLPRPTRLKNIPRILDVQSVCELIDNLGGKCEFTAKNTLMLNPQKIHKNFVDLMFGSKTRVSFLFFAPLLYKFGKCIIPNPGGCRLGERPIDRHVKMMEAFGVSVEYESSTGYYKAHLPNNKFTGADYCFDKKTHTGTELALMIASVAKGESVIDNAAVEPEIDELIDFLNNCGAVIEKKGQTIKVNPAEKPDFTKSSFRIANDRNEAVTYACLALATGGDIRIEGIKAKDIRYFIDIVKKSGGQVIESRSDLRFFISGGLKASHVLTSPHPGFMTDWQGPWAVAMTQAKGISTIHETVFENRFGYVEELKKLGAQIDFFDPKPENPRKLYQFNIKGSTIPKKQAIQITGPTSLHNGVLNVTDLRAGATIIIGAASASGQTIIHGADVIERGYENIDSKLIKLGVRIKKM